MANFYYVFSKTNKESSVVFVAVVTIESRESLDRHFVIMILDLDKINQIK